jgi:hypothetical protein
MKEIREGLTLASPTIIPGRVYNGPAFLASAYSRLLAKVLSYQRDSEISGYGTHIFYWCFVGAKILNIQI